jgi:hypothetical protein
VSSLSMAESEGERGIVRTVSRMWITPPLNIMFAVVTVDFSFRPEKISTDFWSLLDIFPSLGRRIIREGEMVLTQEQPSQPVPP